MAESRLDNVVVVMYEPQDHVNLAATVRAMKNMGLTTLRLVRAAPYDPYRLEGIAHGTQDLIDRITHHISFDEAVSDCIRVMAFTARRRAAKFTIHTPREAAVDLLDTAVDGKVAIVFGREDSGLPNEIVDRVHAAITIPTTSHVSLNLAQAALIAFYELHLVAGDATRPLPSARKSAPEATHDHFELFYADAENGLAAIEFFKTRNSELIMRSLRAIVSRSRPDSRELSLLRAMFIEIVRYLERTGRRP
jgi:TrmH family RNA methyltransferase